MDASIGPLEPPDPGGKLPLGTCVIFMAQQSSSDVIRVTTWQEMPGTIFDYQRKPGDSFILIINDGYGCRLGGVPSARYFSLRQRTEQAVEANRDFQEYKDIFKDI